MTSTAWTLPIPQERMWLQPNEGGSAESDFTRWWRPRSEAFGFPKSFGEPLLAWDAEA
jgi:hypothetical protein